MEETKALETYKKDWKARILTKMRNKGLWVSFFALIPLICQGFGWDFLPKNYNDIINSILSILVMAGLLNNPNEGAWYTSDKKAE
ncbi:holin [Clostridium perfringens]|nr:holin [Clostridium perfringens]